MTFIDLASNLHNKHLVTDTYTLSYLYNHPITKPIVIKYLEPLGIIDQLNNADGTLREMFDYNMGGGIPPEVITALMAELDAIPLPLES